jgi:hypothetical protein
MPTSTSNSPSRSVAQDLDALERVDLGVQVAHPDAELEQVVGEVLGHLLGERGDQHALVASTRAADLVHEVVDLALRWAHDDLGVDQAGRADDLLDDLLTVSSSYCAGVAETKTTCGTRSSELVEAQRPVVERARQPEAVLDERVLRERSPSYMPCICGTVTCDSSMTRGSRRGSSRAGSVRRLARRARRGARVVLDAVAEADLAQHLQVVVVRCAGAAPRAACRAPSNSGEPLVELGLISADRALDRAPSS